MTSTLNPFNALKPNKQSLSKNKKETSPFFYQQSVRKWYNVVDCGYKKFYFYNLVKQEFMTTFVGDFEAKTDDKGRLVLPSAFKRVLNAMGNEHFVVRKDLYEPCLVLFPFAEWEQELNRIREKLNPYNREHSRFLRDFFKGSAELSLDNNGRFLIPKRLMDLAVIDREVILIGIDKKIEIWDKTQYEKSGLSSDELASMAEKFLGNNNPLLD